jgi:mono/diheme cytochrome c family protein
MSRVATSVGVLLMQITFVRPPAIAAQETPVSRDQVFAARCANCHTIEKLTPALSRRRPEALAAFLERFLTRHYAPDPAERKAMIGC